MKKICVLIFSVLLLMGCSERKLEIEENGNRVPNLVEEEVEANLVIEEDTSDSNEITDSMQVDVFKQFEVTVMVEKLNVRSKPDINSDKISLVTLDTKLVVLDIHSNQESGEYWYQIELKDGSIGWIAGWFVVKDNTSFYKLYSDMNTSDDVVAYVDQSNLLARRFKAIYSGDKILYWFETDYLGQKLYFNDYESDMMRLSWTFYFITDSNVVEFHFSEDKPGDAYIGYLETSIETDDGLIYIDGIDRRAYKEDITLGVTSFEPKEIYNSSLWHDLPEEYLFIQNYRRQKWLRTSDNPEVWCYEIHGDQLKKKQVFKPQFSSDDSFVYAYSSPYIIPDDEYSNVSYSGYLKEEDIVGYRRYFDGYSSIDRLVLNIDGKELYAPRTNYSLDVPITVELPNNKEFELSSKSYMLSSPRYNLGYINYQIGSKSYFYNYISEILIPYNQTHFSDHQIYYLKDEDHVILKNESTVYIYDISSNQPNLLFEMDLIERITNVIEHQDNLIIKSHNSGEARLINDGDSYELMYKDDNLSQVYSSMSLDSELLTKDALEDRSYETVLQVLDDKLITWYKTKDGYVIRNTYSRQNVIGDRWIWNVFNFDKISNSSNDQTKNGFNTADLIYGGNIGSQYIIVELEQKFYSINVDTFETMVLGTDLRIIPETNYFITYSEDESKSFIKLYSIGEYITLLDTFTVDRIGGKLSSKYEDMDDVTYSESSNQEANSIFFTDKITFDIHNNKLNPSSNGIKKSIELYEKGDFNSPVIKTVAFDKCKNIINLNRFQLMNGKIIVWYQVEVDEQLLYAYKELSQHANIGYDREIIDIVLEDGSSIGFNTGGECVYYVVKDDLGKYGYLSIYDTWDMIIGYFINMKTGQIYNGQSRNQLFAPNNRMFLSHDVQIGSARTIICLNYIDENEFKEVARFDIGYWELVEAEWINNDEIIIDVDSSLDVTSRFRLVLENDYWIIKEMEK